MLQTALIHFVADSDTNTKDEDWPKFLHNDHARVASVDANAGIVVTGIPQQAEFRLLGKFLSAEIGSWTWYHLFHVLFVKICK